MKILHTSDLHFGVVLNERSLLDEQKFMADSLLKIASYEKVEAVVIAGDVFDKASAPQKALRLYDEFITILCCDMCIPVLICAGNHDSPERLALCNRILEKSGLFVEGRMQHDIKPIIIKDCAFYLIPFFHAETVRALFPDEKIENYQQAFRFICDKIRSEMNPEMRNIIVAHCFAEGGVLSDSDHAARLGGTEQVPADVFNGFDYVALGHLHAPHNVTKTVRYSGTPEKYSFGEKGAEKSVTIFDSETGEIKAVPVPFEKNLRELSGTYLELLDITENDNCKEDFMKITVTDKYPTGDIFEKFKNQYENLLHFDGISFKTESTLSSLTAEEIVRLSPQELLKQYYSNKKESTLDKFELEWFEKALEAVRNGGRM